MKNNEFYAVSERATDLMHIAIINKDYGKAELAYFKTLEEAEEFLRNLELYKDGKTTFKNSRFVRMVEYYVDEYPSYRRVQHIFFIEKKKMAWLDSFSIAGSMIIGMAAAVIVGLL